MHTPAPRTRSPRWWLAIAALAVLPSCLPATAAPATGPDAEKAALQAANSWLSLVDAGKYDESWSGAAKLFKGQVTKAQWKTAITAARKPLGAMKSRKLKGTHAKTALPGAPDGHYVVIQFDTAFAQKAAAVETITPMRDPDGEWRVSGYFIK